ncbi:MAG: NUDIX domain-containing protein [Saprospiraceae bacterium]
MYEIHINESKIFLIKSTLLELYHPSDASLVFKYNKKTKYLLNFIDKAEKSKENLNIYIHHFDLHVLKKDFFSLYKVMKAGGGLVLNRKSKVLMIFRRGAWDLPKGKKEKGETKKQTAIREVQEETGLLDVNIIKPLPNTYHSYKIGKQRVIKLSYWYIMETSEEKLVPQTEEDIVKAEWVDLQDLKEKKCQPIYCNIENLIDSFLKDIRF